MQGSINDDFYTSEAFRAISYVLIAYFACSWLWETIYVLYRHPLRNFPGPKLRLIYPTAFALLDGVTGNHTWQILDWHELYGEVIRSGPNSLSFTCPAAWQDIYGRRGAHELRKSRPTGIKLGPPDILEAGHEAHARYRRLMGPAFSHKAVLRQQPILDKYTYLLLNLIEQKSLGSSPVDFVELFNYTTFDIIGDLAFGASLGGLAKGDTNPWIDNIKRTIKVFPRLALLLRMPKATWVLQRLFFSRLREQQRQHRRYVENLLNHRLSSARESSNIDFVDHFMQAKPDQKGHTDTLTRSELVRNLDTLMVAGSETVATSLSGVTYLLLTQLSCLKQCVSEIDATFEDETQIDAAGVSQLSYLRACLRETLRLYPPVPCTLGRVTGNDQPMGIAGHLVPAQTHVGVPPLAASRASYNWCRPHEFRPERWLPGALIPSSPYYHDRRDAYKPFGYGPRDCIGSNLAWQESSLILARLLWRFDLELHRESQDWMVKQSVFGLWDKPPLWVEVSPRKQREKKNKSGS
ncbi:uncharacterized protein HMPREF1541_03509 [Cyphellophora europaea CBS 101466]|uniref:Cytochrome P450 monooxygenase n=1 Tax=Cyphellophora europaea (strain CBS 101466) TaxID=1220924 RepID=W2S0K7_CYPE1|nr:uncharacterized protein HMPREF1541_03509 [Cyphellophora europaea CBS 101466]ETN41573.1 hypothetical protein HMPREF1541_03509 [Cyphellophora europaea CBS 101466]